jgi:hypothetical protein
MVRLPEGPQWAAPTLDNAQSETAAATLCAVWPKSIFFASSVIAGLFAQGSAFLWAAMV